jgi:hypothetical protein
MISSSSTSSLRARLLFAAAAAAALLSVTACGSAKTVTPSALAAGSSTYDGESVNVSGTVKNPHQRATRRGHLLAYQLCDTACVNVVQFGDATVDDGSTASVTGTFHASFGRIRQIQNVIVVGGRGARH